MRPGSKRLRKRFEKNNGLLQEYSNIIKEQRRLNIVEKYHRQKLITLTKLETFITYYIASNQGWSCNIVSSKFKGAVSNKLIFIVDVAKAILQIFLKPEHRDFVRFLWYKNGNEITSENISQFKYVIIVFVEYCLAWSHLH